MFNFDPDKNSELYTEGILDDVFGEVNETEARERGRARLDREDRTLGAASRTLDQINKSKKTISVNNKSITARAKNSILQFPIYVSQSIRVNEAHIISKLFERVYATIVQAALAQNPIVDEEEVNNLKFLQGFHTNMKESASSLINEYYEPIDEIDAILTESIYHTEKISDDVSVTFSVVPSTNKDLLAENARLMNEPLAGFSYLKEATNEKEQTASTTTSVNPLTEDELEDIAIDRYDDIDGTALNAALKRTANQTDREIRQEARAEHPDDPAGEDIAYEDRVIARNNARTALDKAVDKLKHEIKGAGDKGIDGMVFRNGKYCRSASTSSKVNKNKSVATTPKAPVLLKDADIKKSNGMLPWTIEATFNVRQRDGQITKDVSFIIGIKSILHLIRAQDLEEDLEEIISGNIRSLQKVRYKTGEITFAEYIFNRKNIKKDAAKRINHNKRWLNTLKRLSEYEKLNGSLLKHPAEFVANGSVPVPNGTLILSQIDVNNMANNTGIDISEVGTAKKLVKSLFLLGVVIVDSTAGSMKVLMPDMQANWDVQSLASIDADISKTENSSLLKELQKAVNK